MTNKNIFNAIRSIDEELILGASASEKAPGAKRKILLKALTSAAAVILVISLSIGGAMMMRDANKIPEDKPQETPQDPPKQPDGFASMAPPSMIFLSLDELKAYIDDKENQKKDYLMDEGVYVDFGSIIPNSEISRVSIHEKNSYTFHYIHKDIKEIGYEDVWISITKEEQSTEDQRQVDVSCETMNEVKAPQSLSDHYHYIQLKIGDQSFHYNCSSLGMYSLTIYINEYRISFHWREYNEENDYRSEQYEFLSTIVPEYGATDESLMETFNKIKALIPESDEANHSQEKEDADTTDTASTNDGIVTDTPVSEPAYEEETSNETYEEEEEYLYPDDYEFPVIPGISPDWKPNRNGKYPLKDGYTREEMTLIVACAIELDFGDMTDEEISKIDFIIIDDEEETEDNTEQ